MRYNVDCALIEKRNKAICDGYERHDCKHSRDLALLAESKGSSSRKIDIFKFFSECGSPSNANNYYTDCLKIMETENEDDPKFTKRLSEKFVDYVLPYIVNLEGVTLYIDDYRIDPSIINTITEATEAYKVCDRVLDNHRKISKRFNIESYIDRKRNKSTKEIVLNCCKMIDTYNLKPHAKMNVCLEEVSYLLQKEGVEYEKSDLVKAVTEYFLNTSNNTGSVIRDKYKMVLSENSMISDNDLTSVDYFVNDNHSSRSMIENYLNRFTISDNKDIGGLCNMINQVFADDTGRDDFVFNVTKILDYTRSYLMNDNFDIDEVINCLCRIPQKVSACMSGELNLFTRDDIDRMISQYQDQIDRVDYDIEDSEDQDLISKLVKFKDYCVDTVNTLNQIRSEVYPEYNIECIQTMNAMTEASHPLYLNEFKTYKFNNLVTMAMKAASDFAEADRKIGKKIANLLKPKKKRGKSLLKIKLEDAITTENTADLLIYEYDIVNNENFYEAHDYLTSVCKSINETLLASNDCKCYYIVLGETVEVHITDESYILMDESSDMGIMSEEDLELAVQIESLSHALDGIDLDAISGVYEAMMYRTEEIDYERAISIIEATQYIECIDKHMVQRFEEEFEYYNDDLSISEGSSLKSTLRNWEEYHAPLSIQMEATDIIYGLLESDEEKNAVTKAKEEKENQQNDEEKKSPVNVLKDKFSKKKDDSSSDDKDKDKEEKEKKGIFSGINLNNIQLALKGIKVKMKDLSNKEKQLCNNMDMEANRLYSAAKDAMTNDRREGIIKGSVVPSFSKCIKAGVALAGLGLATGNPAIPCIAAIGGMAMSKKLNKQERALLADDIDVELKVVEKELEVAESRGQTKKMRELMMIQKDLERQKTRINYNVKLGRDILPGSTGHGVAASKRR